ncbi:HAD hydrolase-like protein [Candidatus Woesearchaeota archaeon]|nr:HAD hydrolase-like protein [Candidatus Woesearchaeota archaeon]
MGNLFVWDFHGVLETGNEYAVQDVVNKVLPEFGISRKATVEECLMLYGKKWADYYRFYNSDADEETIHRMVEKAVEISVGEKIARKYMKATEYAHDVLGSIRKKGDVNLIMSNSSPEALDYFLEIVNMQDSFDFKFAADGHRIEYSIDSKARYLEEFLKDRNFDKIIVIDDMEEGIERGLKFNAITFMYNRNRTQVKSKAHHIITDLREVLKV